MRICLVGRREAAADPATLHLAASLRAAGNDVALVCGGRPHAAHTFPGNVTWVPTRRPKGGGPAGWLLRRLQPRAMRENLLAHGLVTAARATGADLYYPLSIPDLAAAVAAAGSHGAVFRLPHWPEAGARDIVGLASREPGWGTPAGEALHAAGPPAPGRHTGRRLLLAYRRTEQNPGRYLEAAVRRSGATITAVHDHLDWSAIDPATEAVVFVESPLPRIEQRSVNPGIPVLLWVHHGEHHLEANLRLARQYQADAVLLAHSWHLAHRFGVPTHRFPFGVPIELFGDAPPWEERAVDVAMVGSGLRSTGGRYRRRSELVASFESADDLSVRFESGVGPEVVAEAYAGARVVVNEGGDRHHPITMRVFEAMGAGSFLLTDPQPGLETLFDPGRHFGALGPDPVGHVRRLLADPNTSKLAAAAHTRAMEAHTYDHRVDTLFRIAAGTERGPHRPERPDGMVDVIDGDVDVDTLIDLGGPGRAPFPLDRIVLDASAGSADGVIVRRATPTDDLARALGIARRFVYATVPVDEHRIRDLVDGGADIAVEAVPGGSRIDLGAPGYRVRPDPRTAS